MFQFADRRLGRRLFIGSLSALCLTCLMVSVGGWYALRCNVLDYVDRALDLAS